MRRVLLMMAAILGTAAVSPAGTVDYTYDQAGRLIQADYGTAILDYEYDPSGNLLRRTVTAENDILFRDGFESGNTTAWN